MGRYVAITGAIAAGATTMSNVLHERLGWVQLDERQVEFANEFFVDAYTDFPRWGLHSQITFMLRSAEKHENLKRLLQTADADSVYVEDRTPFEHVEGYLVAYSNLGMISPRETRLLRRLAAKLSDTYVTPDLFIYRRISDQEAANRVRERARPGERDASPEFLRGVREAFDHMAAQWNRCPILVLDADVDVLDSAKAQIVVDEIQRALPHH